MSNIKSNMNINKISEIKRIGMENLLNNSNNSDNNNNNFNNNFNNNSNNNNNNNNNNSNNNIQGLPELYWLGLDVIEHIVTYITDPDDLDSLYESDPWLFKNVIPRCVTKLYKHPDITYYIYGDIFKKYPRLKSIRCDYRIENIEDLDALLVSSIENSCVRISSESQMYLLEIIDEMNLTGYLNNRAFRLEQYDPYEDVLEDVWIGRNKFCSDYGYFLPYLDIYKNNIVELLLDVSVWSNPDHTEVLATLPNLTKIYMLENGYYSYSSVELYSMLTINRNIEHIESLVSDYPYMVDPTDKWNEIEEFLSRFVRHDEYPNMKTLFLPIDLLDYIYINNSFPNLENIGMRYIHNVYVSNNKRDDLIEDIIEDIIDDVTDDFESYYKLLKGYNNVRIYLYIVFDDIESKQFINRNIELKPIISRRIGEFIESLGTKNNIIDVIDMENQEKCVIETVDDWLFNI